MTAQALYATCPLGLAAPLAEELAELGCDALRPGRAGVAFSGPLTQAYRVCLWSRLASRVLLRVARFPAPEADALYAGVREVDWAAHLGSDNTLAVHATGRNAALRHTGFAARRVKDGVVDQLREATGQRPSVDLKAPDLSLHLHLQGTWAELSVDLAGTALNQRGYRVAGAPAPLKETLAAALLRLLGWPRVAAEGGAFCDPMCGSGTLPIEAACMAVDRAPGLGRDRFGFERWRGHDAPAWQGLMAEAEQRFESGLRNTTIIQGFDADKGAVRAALEAVDRAGLTGHVHVERRELADCAPPLRATAGLVAVNPPYGERLGEVGELRLLYRSLGQVLAQRFAGWRAGVLTGSDQLAGSLDLKPQAEHRLYNGGLEVTLLDLELPPATGAPSAAAVVTEGPRGPGAEAFSGRLKKRARHLSRWARKNDVHCYRVYDADLPDYAAAIDRYEDFVHLQEYAPPKTVDPARAAERLADMLALVPEALGVDSEQVFLKVRRRQRGRAQYQALGRGGEFHPVREGGHRFLVNFTDYLDTGLFLDSRAVRRLVAELAPGRRMLNLFGYTGSASVYAAKAGATSTTTVDLSNTYLGWARRNFALNGLPERGNELWRADCLTWLAEQRRQWDLILLDPPTFSNSKGMDGSFDVQRDHVALLHAVAARLAPQGVLVFSNNYRKFKLDTEALSGWQIEDRTRQTLDEDFQRSRRAHCCFVMRPT